MPRAASPPSSVAITRRLLATGIFAGPIFVVAVVAQALTRDGFDLGRHPASMLSLGDLGWIQVGNFVIAGALVVTFAFAASRSLRDGAGARLGPILITAFGVGLIVAGVFVGDPAFGFPPGAPAGVPETLSLHAVLHGVGFTLAFLSVSGACLVFARRFLAARERGWAVYSVATAAVATALSMIPGQDGASVRYFIATVLVWAWVSAVAAKLANQAARTAEPRVAR
jgi:hypothetical membrane protein